MTQPEWGDVLDEVFPFLFPVRCFVSFLCCYHVLSLSGATHSPSISLLPVSLLFCVLGKEHGIGRSVGVLPGNRIPKVPVLASFLSLMCIYHFSIYCQGRGLNFLMAWFLSSFFLFLFLKFRFIPFFGAGTELNFFGKKILCSLAYFIVSRLGFLDFRIMSIH